MWHRHGYSLSSKNGDLRDKRPTRTSVTYSDWNHRRIAYGAEGRLLLVVRDSAAPNREWRWSISVGPGLQQVRFLGANNRLGAVDDFQLAIDIERVGFHRPRANHQLRCNLWIGHAGCHQTEH